MTISIEGFFLWLGSLSFWDLLVILLVPAIVDYSRSFGKSTFLLLYGIKERKKRKLRSTLHPNFKHGKLIEHFKCGNVTLEESYKNNICPKCHKEIKTIGVDYKVLENYYICTDCGDKFAEPSREYLCLHCNNKFKLDQAKWTTSEGFRALNL